MRRRGAGVNRFADVLLLAIAEAASRVRLRRRWEEDPVAVVRIV